MVGLFLLSAGQRDEPYLSYLESASTSAESWRARPFQIERSALGFFDWKSQLNRLRVGGAGARAMNHIRVVGDECDRNSVIFTGIIDTEFVLDMRA